MSITIQEDTRKNIFDGTPDEKQSSRFFLATSDVATDEVTVAEASGVPDYFDARSSGSTLLMKEKRARSIDPDTAGRYRWEVQCDYSDKLQHPLDVPPAFEWDFSEASEEYFFDTDTSDSDFPNGKPVVNSAGQQFDSLPTRETGEITVNITVNVASDFDLSLFLSFRQTINDASFTVDGVSIDEAQAKFSGANLSAVLKAAGDEYRVAKLTLKFRQTWDDVFADMGLFYLDTGESGIAQLKPILVGNPPVQTPKPYPLDGSGNAASDPTDPPAKITRKPYLRTDYSDLSALF